MATQRPLRDHASVQAPSTTHPPPPQRAPSSTADFIHNPDTRTASMAAPTEPRLQLSFNTSNRSQAQPSSSFAAARPAASTEHAHQLPAALQAGNLHSGPGSVATTVLVASPGTAPSTQPVQQPLGYQQALSSIATTVPATSASTALPAQPVQKLSGSQQRLSFVATTVPLACTRSASPIQHSWPITPATQASRGPAAQTVQPAGDSQPGHSPDQPATPVDEQAELPPGEGRDLPGLSQGAAQSSEARQAATSGMEHGLQPAEEATSSEDVEVVLDASDTSPAKPCPAAAAAVGHQGTRAGPSGSALSRQAGSSFQSSPGSAQPAAAIRQSRQASCSLRAGQRSRTSRGCACAANGSCKPWHRCYTRQHPRRCRRTRSGPCPGLWDDRARAAEPRRSSSSLSLSLKHLRCAWIQQFVCM